MPETTFDPVPSDPDKLLRPPRSEWDGGGDRSHLKTFVLAASLMAAIGLGAPAVHVDVAAAERRAHCIALLGQSSLSHFDLRSSRTQWVEFLTMTPRGRV